MDADASPTASARQQASQGSGHEVGHRAGEHGPEAQDGEVMATAGNEARYASDLDTDGAEVREPAKGISSDQKRLRLKRFLDFAKLRVRHEFVDDHAGAEKVTDSAGIRPGKK